MFNNDFSIKQFHGPIDPRNPCDLRKFLTHAPTPPTSPRYPRNLADSHELVFDDTDYFLCNIKLFVSTQKCTFVLDIVSNIVSWWYIFVVTCQRKTKFHFYYHKKKFAFCASQIFYIQFLNFTLAACWSSSLWF